MRAYFLGFTFLGSVAFWYWLIDSSIYKYPGVAILPLAVGIVTISLGGTVAAYFITRPRKPKPPKMRVYPGDPFAPSIQDELDLTGM